jgi:transcriptional regulator with XRE-family HTH domain
MMPVRRLKELRESRFLTQADLATRSGVAEVTINRLEAGERPARFSTIRKLAEALGVAPADLTGTDG